MTKSNSFNNSAIAICLIACIIIFSKVSFGNIHLKSIVPEKVFQVTYHFNYKKYTDNVVIRCFLPVNNVRQEVIKEKNKSQHHNLSIQHQLNNNRLANWRAGKSRFERQNIEYSFDFIGKHLEYKIDRSLLLDDYIQDTLLNKFLLETESIQSKHRKVDSISTNLIDKNYNLYNTLEAFYDYCFKIPSLNSAEQMTSLSVIKTNQANCNGKSRLFVALCRNSGIPARMVGGIILENTSKKTSHGWAEVYINKHWVPFDVLNNHFASLPAHYMQLYSGDLFLLKHTKDIDFNYLFEIKSSSIASFQKDSKHYNIGLFNTLTLWNLYDSDSISKSLLQTLLLIPIAALLIILLKNIVGVKTFGIFLPALLALSFIQTGFVFGLIVTFLLIGLLLMFQYWIADWLLLYAPKVGLLLLFISTFSLIIMHFAISNGLTTILNISLFPIVVIAITSERFMKKISEDGSIEAVKLMMQTLIVASLCFLVIQSKFLQSFLLTFPEMYAFVAVALMFSGKWIGIRLLEYNRFNWTVQTKKID